MAKQAEFTSSGIRSTAGDGTAAIAAPASARLRWHITGLILAAGNPGTDEVTVEIKSGETVMATLAINDTVPGYMGPVEIVCGLGEAVYVALDESSMSEGATVNWTLSGYLRSDGRPELS